MKHWIGRLFCFFEKFLAYYASLALGTQTSIMEKFVCKLARFISEIIEQISTKYVKGLFG
jgi:hypothetical protein